MDNLRSILIVEDSEDLINLIEATLRPLGVHLFLASDGTKAMELLNSRTFDAVLTDFVMPHMNGIQLIEAMRHAGIETPVVMLTGYPDQKLLLQTLRLGAADFLEKPFTVPELVAVMGRVTEIGFRGRRIKHVQSEALASGAPLDDHVQEGVARDRKMITLLQLASHYRKTS